MNDDTASSLRHWYGHLGAIDQGIAQLALVCQVPLLDAGVIERVLRNDVLVCGHRNDRVFAKLRALLMMHYSVRDRAVVALGQTGTLELVGEIVSQLRDRVGDRLGGPPRRLETPPAPNPPEG